MRIQAYNPGHDGASALVENGRLIYSLESEKDNGPRYDRISLPLFLRSLAFEEPPDVVALSGFFNTPSLEVLSGDVIDSVDAFEAGYWDEGCSGKTTRETLFAGHKLHCFSSSHVRSHIMCAYGLSPFPQGQPCYVLIWEGLIGAMYFVDRDVSIHKVGDVLRYPGARYLSLYALGNPQPTKNDAAGKLMALAAYGRSRAPTCEEREIVDAILTSELDELLALLSSSKSRFDSGRYFNIGVESQEFKDLAWQFSAALFDRFFQFARKHVTPGLPLLIAGGCGLNCDWNTQWRQCGLFSDVFVPPCANDSGVAIGASVDAQHHYTGEAKLQWNVYAGDPFIEDVTESPYFDSCPISLPDVCRCLVAGDIIAWVQGRYEIGPRALGNRSLLAAPFSAETRNRLNRIKQREAFRPIAPICLEDELSRHFEYHGASPHMLYFQRVRSKQLAAVTHADGTARAQSVKDSENPEICALLREFSRQSGVGVLCNTSLNFSGRGFINRLSHLFKLARDREIDGLAVGARFWKLRRSALT
jgi:predicted NodU family carbamoyl transferase